MKIKIIQTKENRPATPRELEELINNEDGKQLFMNWYNKPTEKQKGIVSIDLDSGYGSNFHTEDEGKNTTNNKLEKDKWILWRWKKDGNTYSESRIQEKRGNMLALTTPESWTDYPDWIDISEIDIAWIGNKQ